jgi:hypothetical protein
MRLLFARRALLSLSRVQRQRVHTELRTYTEDTAPRAVVVLHRHGDRAPIHNAYKHDISSSDTEEELWEDRLVSHAEDARLAQVCSVMRKPCACLSMTVQARACYNMQCKTLTVLSTLRFGLRNASAAVPGAA